MAKKLKTICKNCMYYDLIIVGKDSIRDACYNDNDMEIFLFGPKPTKPKCTCRDFSQKIR